MPTARHYTRLSNPRASLHADREMDAAFDDDDKDDHGETAPLTLHQQRTPVSIGPPRPLRSISDDDASAPSTYDFERDYDQPPPGSPPAHTTFAFPNDYGNSNGLLPASPVVRSPQRSIFSRTFGAFFPQSYQRLPGGDSRPRGGGTDNDGVFANVTAKPTPPISMRVDSGDVHIVPEETQQEAPPVRVFLFSPFLPLAEGVKINLRARAGFSANLVLSCSVVGVSSPTWRHRRMRRPPTGKPSCTPRRAWT